MQPAGLATGDTALLDLLLLGIGVALGATVTAGLLLQARARSSDTLDEATRKALCPAPELVSTEAATKADPFETAPRSGCVHEPVTQREFITVFLFELHLRSCLGAIYLESLVQVPQVGRILHGGTPVPAHWKTTTCDCSW